MQESSEPGEAVSLVLPPENSKLTLVLRQYRRGKPGVCVIGRAVSVLTALGA